LFQNPQSLEVGRTGLRSREQFRFALEVAVSAASVGAIIRLGQGVASTTLVLGFLAVVFLLDLLDLRLPYGDVMPVDTSLLATALIVAGAETAAIAAVFARVAVHIARHGTSEIGELLDVVSRRLFVILICSQLLPLLRELGLGELALSVSISGLFVGLDLVVAQAQAVWRLREGFLQLLAGNFSLQWPLLAAQISVASLAVLTFENMRVWGLALMVVLVLLMRQSLGLLLEIRSAYRATIEALVASMELQNRWRRGHAERVERIAREIGLRLGLRGAELEALGYAALLHDVDLIGVDQEVLDSGEGFIRHSADTIEGVGFLSNVVPVLAICDGNAPTIRIPDAARLAAMIVAVASDYDDSQTNGAPVRSAATDLVRPLVGEDVGRRAIDAASALGFSTPLQS
jgi:hypothetical protein